MTVYEGSWWMTSLPSMYSKMALSPPASEIERCSEVNLRVPGM